MARVGHLSVTDTVVFDLDGVLARPHRERRLAMLANWSGQQAEGIDLAICKSDFEEEAERGLWSPESYLNEIRRRLGYQLTVDEWITSRRATTEPDPDVGPGSDTGESYASGCSPTIR